MKKIVLSLLCLCLTLTPVAFASANLSTHDAEEITLFYSHADKVKASLTIDSSGNAKCTGRVSAQKDSYKCSVTVQLKKMSGNQWTGIGSWVASGKGITGATASGTKKVSSGTYKVVVTGKIKDADGNVLETVTKETKPKTY